MKEFRPILVTDVFGPCAD